MSAYARFPATVAAYCETSKEHSFTTFLVRTVSDMHGSGRGGSNVGVGSGNRMQWTGEHFRAAAVKILIARTIGRNVKTTYAQLRDARWDRANGLVHVRFPGAVVVLAAPAALMEEHAPS